VPYFDVVPQLEPECTGAAEQYAGWAAGVAPWLVFDVPRPWPAESVGPVRLANGAVVVVCDTELENPVVGVPLASTGSPGGFSVRGPVDNPGRLIVDV